MGFQIPIGVIIALGRVAGKVFSGGSGSTVPEGFILNPAVAGARLTQARLESAQERGSGVTFAQQEQARLILRDEPQFIRDPAIEARDAQARREAEAQAETIAALALLDFPAQPPPQPSPPPFSGPPPSGEPILLPLPPPVEPPDVTVETKEEPKVANGFELIPFLSGVANVFGAASELGSVIRGPVAAPSPATAGIVPQVISSGVGAMAGSAVSGFLFGNGNGTPLSRARDASGRRPTRRQVITAARVCGLEVAAQSFGLSVTDICTIVSKGMPRRSRGISSADMRRTRSTLRKMATMRKTLKPLCR